MSNFKYPPITSISSSSTRSKDWEDVVTAHADDSIAHTWRVQDKRLGSWTFEVEDGVIQVYDTHLHPATDSDGSIQALCVTACGNFGLVGSSTGEVRMWNMQSGKERKSFRLTGPPPGDTKSKIIASSKSKKAKVSAVKKNIQAITGLVTDALNTTVIASTLEGKLYVRFISVNQVEHS